MSCRKGVWKFGTLQCVYVLSVRLSPPGERHDIPDCHAVTLWRNVSWTTSRFTILEASTSSDGWTASGSVVNVT